MYTYGEIKIKMKGLLTDLIENYNKKLENVKENVNINMEINKQYLRKKGKWHR